MSLPAIARRIDLTLLRPAAGAVDEWNRPDRTALDVVATWRGDLQPDRNLRGSREGDTSTGMAPAPTDYTVYAEPGLVIMAGDVIRRTADDGVRYYVAGAGRLVGEGMNLAHVIARVTTVRRP